jgi:hypothetical protein
LQIFSAIEAFEVDPEKPEMQFLRILIPDFTGTFCDNIVN